MPYISLTVLIGTVADLGGQTSHLLPVCLFLKLFSADWLSVTSHLLRVLCFLLKKCYEKLLHKAALDIFLHISLLSMAVASQEQLNTRNVLSLLASALVLFCSGNSVGFILLDVSKNKHFWMQRSPLNRAKWYAIRKENGACNYFALAWQKSVVKSVDGHLLVLPPHLGCFIVGTTITCLTI